MKRLADLDPEILAEILGEKPVSIPPDTSKSTFSPRQRFFMEKAAEEDICLDFFHPDESKADAHEGAEDDPVNSSSEGS